MKQPIDIVVSKLLTLETSEIPTILKCVQKYVQNSASRIA